MCYEVVYPTPPSNMTSNLVDLVQLNYNQAQLDYEMAHEAQIQAYYAHKQAKKDHRKAEKNCELAKEKLTSLEESFDQKESGHLVPDVPVFLHLHCRVEGCSN